MKLYTKIVDGQSFIMPANKIVVIKDGMQTFNPTEDILLSDGWKEYIAPENELTDEQILAQEKENKINDVIEYDSSDNVNLFHLNDIPIWLDRETRRSLMGRFQAEIKKGKASSCLWHLHHKFELTPEKAVELLDTLEIYASECFDKTQEHICNIYSLNNIEDIQRYDFCNGYPSKLVLYTK